MKIIKNSQNICQDVSLVSIYSINYVPIFSEAKFKP